MLYEGGRYVCDAHPLDRLANNKRRRRALPQPEPAPQRTLIQVAFVELSVAAFAEKNRFDRRVRALVAKHNERVAAEVLQQLLAESPGDFEGRVANLLRARGYADVQVLGGPNDGGVDIIAKHDVPLGKARTVAVQVKRYRTSIGRRWVDELLGVVRRRQHELAEGILITTSDFSSRAREAASGQPLELVSGRELVGLFAKHDILLQVGTIGEFRDLSDKSKNLSDLLVKLLPNIHGRLVTAKNKFWTSEDELDSFLIENKHLLSEVMKSDLESSLQELTVRDSSPRRSSSRR